MLVKKVVQNILKEPINDPYGVGKIQMAIRNQKRFLAEGPANEEGKEQSGEDPEVPRKKLQHELLVSEMVKEQMKSAMKEFWDVFPNSTDQNWLNRRKIEDALLKKKIADGDELMKSGHYEKLRDEIEDNRLKLIKVSLEKADNERQEANRAEE